MKNNSKCDFTRTFSMDVNNGTIAGVSGVLAIVTMLFNYIAFISLRKKKPCTLLFRGLVFLSVLDGLTGLIVLPLYSIEKLIDIVKNRTEVTSNVFLLAIQRFTGYTLQSSGAITVTFIAFQFFYSVVKPFFYTSSYNKKYSIKSLYIGWMVSAVVILVFSIIPPRHWKPFQVFVHLCSGAIFVVISILYSFTLAKMRKLNYTHPYGYVRRKWGNSLTICIWIVVAYFLSYAPLVIFTFYEFSTQNISCSVFRYVEPWMVLLSLTSSFLNPLIYCFRLKDVQNNLSRMTLCIVNIFCHIRKYFK